MNWLLMFLGLVFMTNQLSAQKDTYSLFKLVKKIPLESYYRWYYICIKKKLTLELMAQHLLQTRRRLILSLTKSYYSAVS